MILLLCIVFVWLFLGQIVLTVLAAVASMIAVSFLDGILNALIPKSLVAYLKHKLNPPPPKRRKRRVSRMTIYGPVPADPPPAPIDLTGELLHTAFIASLLGIALSVVVGPACDFFNIAITGPRFFVAFTLLTAIVGWVRFRLRVNAQH